MMTRRLERHGAFYVTCILVLLVVLLA